MVVIRIIETEVSIGFITVVGDYFGYHLEKIESKVSIGIITVAKRLFWAPVDTPGHPGPPGNAPESLRRYSIDLSSPDVCHVCSVCVMCVMCV